MNSNQGNKRKLVPGQPRAWSMTNEEIQSFLGQQYADTLKENKDTAGIYRDCEDVIHGSLALLERYNKVRLAMGSRTRVLPGFVS
jgi:hypothetical protein